MPRISRRNRKQKTQRVKQPKSRRRRAKRNNGVITTSIVVPRGLHSPLPMRLLTKFTASGYFSLAAATAAYSFPIKLGSPRLPFAGAALTGITWNNLTPASFQPPGFGILVSSTVYVQGFVKSVLIEFDCTPQSVQDSVVITGTATNTSGTPSSVGLALTRPWTKQQGFASGRQYRQGDYPWRHRVTIHDFYGIPALLYNNDQSGVWNFSPSTDPTLGTFYQFNVETGDAANLSLALECRIRLTYSVLLRDLATEALT